MRSAKSMRMPDACAAEWLHQILYKTIDPIRSPERRQPALSARSLALTPLRPGARFQRLAIGGADNPSNVFAMARQFDALAIARLRHDVGEVVARVGHRNRKAFHAVSHAQAGSKKEASARTPESRDFLAGDGAGAADGGHP